MEKRIIFEELISRLDRYGFTHIQKFGGGREWEK